MDSILTPKIDQNIAFQVREITKGLQKKQSQKLPNITISREFGCEGFPVAQALQQKLKEMKKEFRVYSRDLLNSISQESDLSDELRHALTEKQRGQIEQDLEHIMRLEPTDFAKYKTLAKNFKVIAEGGGAIIVGSGGSVLARDAENFFHLRLTGSLKFRINRISKVLNIDIHEARELVERRTNNRREFIKKFTGSDISDASLYHMVLKNDVFDADQISDLIIRAMQMRNII